MWCSVARKMINLELDGELHSDKYKRALKEHLANCRKCSAYYEKLQSIKKGIRNFPKYQIKGTMVAVIMKRIHQEQVKTSEKHLVIANIFDRIFSPALVGTVSATIVIIALNYFYSNYQNSQQLSNKTKTSAGLVVAKPDTAIINDTLKIKEQNNIPAWYDYKIEVNDRH